MTAMTATTAARRNGGRLGLVALQVRVDVAAALRNTSFLVGAVAIPVLLYAMFGLPNGADTFPDGTKVTAVMMASFAAYGVVSLAVFTFGEWVARERGRGWTRTLSAGPLPTWVYLAGKTGMAVVCAAAVTAGLAVTGVLVGGVRLPAGTWAAFAAVTVAGVVAFSTFGFAIAYLVRPKAAATIANLVFLPLSFCSGFFFPLSQLPSVLQSAAAYLPTHHFGQLLWATVATPGDVEALVGAPPSATVVHLAWVAGWFVLCGAAALWAARREAATRRG